MILLAVLFLLLSAFFSGSEIAYFSANKLKIELLKETGTVRGRILTRFFEKPKAFIGTMLIGNNIALIILAILFSRLIDPFLEDFIGSEVVILLINTILLTIVLLIFGEYLPKTVFRVYADNILAFLALPLRLIQWILHPFTWCMTALTSVLLKVFFKNTEEESVVPFSRLDLEKLIETSSEGEEEENNIDTDLFKNALHIRNVRVKDSMIPRNEIVAMEVGEGIESLIKLFHRHKLSRIIIYKNDIDNIIGYIHHQQMLKKPKKLNKIALQIPYVPEVMNVLELMNLFIKQKKNIACVVDEFGGISGIITLEDVLEEIFGEIEDEHDKEEYIEKKINDKTWIFSGRLEIDLLNEKYGFSFPESDEFNTLSGYIVMTMANIPEEGDIINLGNYQFILEKVSNTKIELLKVVVLDSDQETKDN